MAWEIKGAEIIEWYTAEIRSVVQLGSGLRYEIVLSEVAGTWDWAIWCNGEQKDNGHTRSKAAAKRASWKRMTKIAADQGVL